MKYKIIEINYGLFKQYYLYYKKFLLWYPIMDWVAGHPRAFDTENQARKYAKSKFKKPLEVQF